MAKLKIKVSGRLGLFLLGVWLVLYALVGVVHLHFEGLPMVMAILAGISGVLIILGI
jgi:hypothetical protein